MCQKHYHISVKGTLIEVTKEQYLCYYRSERRMRYFEHDIKTQTTIRDKDGNITGYIPSKEDSLDRLFASGKDFADGEDSVEDIVIRRLISDKLHDAVDNLPKGERALIEALYFSNGGDGMSERTYAEISGIPRKSVAYRKTKILNKLKLFLNF